MNPEEKQNLLADLESSRDTFLHALRDVSEDAASRAPAPGRWSVLECVEHVAVAEEYLFSQIASAQRVESPPGNLIRERRIVARGLDRSKPMSAPEEARPRGRFATLAIAVEHFIAVRSKTIAFVQACEEDLRTRLAKHPLVGDMNCYELLLVIAVHPLRHSQQIGEVLRREPHPTPTTMDN